MKKSGISILLIFLILSLYAQDNKNDIESFTDSRNGATYKIIKIGRQTWMAENFNLIIPEGGWCYNDSTMYCSKHGVLYDWETAKKVCPDGWHLPTVKDFEILVSNWSMPVANEYESTESDSESAENDAYRHLIKDGNSGFNSLLSGWRFSSGFFYGIENFTGFWSSSPGGFGGAWRLYLDSKNKTAEVSSYYKNFAFSVRCIRN